LDQLTTRILFDSLRSDVCPVAGCHKGQMQTLCRGHYFDLPASQRKALYAGIAHGYQEAVVAAFRTLQVEAFIPARPIDPASGGRD
jgi:hypothetical protein